jgi:hypothetical protein
MPREAMTMTEHVSDFKTLLKDTVNLDQSRLDDLATSTDAIFKALQNDDTIGEHVLEKIPQGSWAHRTIIKPKKDAEFDADFLLRLTERPEWQNTPSLYLDAVYDALTDDGRYKRQPRDNKHRCVRVVYANDYHVDIVPFVAKKSGGGWVINSEANDGFGEWEPTDPAGYTKWIKDRDDLTGGNLRKVVRLLKYLRDHRGWYPDTKSIILTTIIGKQVTPEAKAATPGCYANVPTTLLTVTTAAASWLTANETRPSIDDPSGSGASFDRRWTAETYAELREDMYALAERIKEAHGANVSDSRTLWNGLFGTGFSAPASSSTSTAAGATAGVFGTTAADGPSGRAG